MLFCCNYTNTETQFYAYHLASCKSARIIDINQQTRSSMPAEDKEKYTMSINSDQASPIVCVKIRWITSLTKKTICDLSLCSHGAIV